MGDWPWIGFRSRGGGGGLGAILTGLCWFLHLDLCFEGDGVVHQEPIRGVVKVGQGDEVFKSPTACFGIVDVRFVASLLATLFWIVLANYGECGRCSHFPILWQLMGGVSKVQKEGDGLVFLRTIPFWVDFQLPLVAPC